MKHRLAKPNCKKCFGEGTLGTVYDNKKHRMTPQVCPCVVKNIKKELKEAEAREKGINELNNLLAQAEGLEKERNKRTLGEWVAIGAIIALSAGLLGVIIWSLI